MVGWNDPTEIIPGAFAAAAIAADNDGCVIRLAPGYGAGAKLRPGWLPYQRARV
ncbi:hypothetical protein D3C76_499390 [compost metagenome]